MIKRITFTSTKAQAHIIEGYRRAYNLDKPQDVLSAGLAQLEKAQKVHAYNQLASQMQADASPEQEAAQPHEELETVEQREGESEVWQPRSPLLSGHDGGAE